MWPTGSGPILLANLHLADLFSVRNTCYFLLFSLSDYIFFKRNLIIFDCSMFEVLKEFCFEQVALKLNISKILRKGDISWKTRQVNAKCSNQHLLAMLCITHDI